MRDIVLYDMGRYDLLVGKSNVISRRAHIAKGDMICLRDRCNGIIYRDVYLGENRCYSLVFLELAGGIYVEPAFRGYIPCEIRTLYSEMIEGNSVHVEYDGITHITIEDRDYIYRYNMPYFAHVDVKCKDNIFLIIIDYCEKRRIIIVKKVSDYVELLNIEGNEVIIGENSISVTTSLHDSLGRIRREEYTLVDDNYISTNTHFEYTYNVHYDDRVLTLLIEDALIARDYHFISQHISQTMDEDTLRDYFTSILRGDFDILREDIVGDTMHFIVRDDGLPYLVNIRLYMDKDGIITNFDEVGNE